MTDLVTVAGIPLPEPSTYRGLTSTVVDSARNVEGYMVGAVVRDDIAKVEIGWSYLTTAQWSNILKLFSIPHGGSFINDVKFFDQTSDGYITRSMYVSDRTAGLWRRDPDTGKVMGFTGCALSLVEV